MICTDVWPRAHSLISAVALCLIATPLVAEVVAPSAVQPVLVLDIPVSFIPLALTLLGVAIFHHKALRVALTLLSRHFENSRLPDEMPALLPDGWKGGLALAIVFVLSSFLDNIAAALIGGTIALAILGWNPDPPHKVELRLAHITQITLGDVS